ncbi:class I glutamine amidotransferase-like protein [Schizophyllum amplum]|uniref:Class I glutamine amidotransferase-like protein n=1 Tax=Schizophyllum amplum TaxID=97359 RepID=A0A550C065_9AGAR|nr:class I glutamine amidotransferase-like protein [Auriculariopsis ampla]
MSTPSLSVAVCLYPLVTALDYQGPVEFLAALTASAKPFILKEHSTGFEDTYDSIPTLGPLTYLAPSNEPTGPGISGEAGPRVIPDKTYAEATEQFDILLVPGGFNPGPPELLDFLTRQVPGAKYVLTVCTGSWILAKTGALDGKRATGNKFLFKKMQADTEGRGIQWVARARWVEDGKFWTSSGVTAGMDMAYAFVTHIAGEPVAKAIAAVIELRARDQEDDEFAVVHGLV